MRGCIGAGNHYCPTRGWCVCLHSGVRVGSGMGGGVDGTTIRQGLLASARIKGSNPTIVDYLPPSGVDFAISMQSFKSPVKELEHL